MALVKYKYSYGAGAVIAREEINIWTDQKISRWASQHCHKIQIKNGKMYQKGEVIPHVTQLQAVDKLENFIQGSEYIIAHGAVDFMTIRALLDKTKQSPSYEGVQKVDSQSFYKSVMWYFLH